MVVVISYAAPPVSDLKRSVYHVPHADANSASMLRLENKMTKEETTLYWVDAPVMIFDSVDMEKFCKKHRVDPFTAKCDCGNDMVVNIPFHSLNRWGLCAKRCDCGQSEEKENCPFVTVMTSEQIDSGEPIFSIKPKDK